MDVITAEGLVKIYKSRKNEVRALDGIDLSVAEGTVLGLLGPNGAGKTTAVRILATLLKPDAGRATVAGLDVVRQAQQIRTLIGLSGQYAAVDENLTGRENLWMFGRLYQLPNEVARTRCRGAPRAVRPDRRRRPRGQDLLGWHAPPLGPRQRPDRPAATPVPRRADDRARPTQPLGMWDVIRSLVREGVTLLLTTQYLEEADELADRIAVVDHGKIIARGTADDLKAQVGGERIEIVVHDRTRIDDARRILGEIGLGSASVDEHTRRVTAPSEGGAKRLSSVIRDFDEVGIAIDDIGLRRPTLDDVFLSLTGHTAVEEQTEDAA